MTHGCIVSNVHCTSNTASQKGLGNLWMRRDDCVRESGAKAFGRTPPGGKEVN